MGQDDLDFKARVHHVVARIPEGSVASYGQIAHLAGAPRAARAVGNILKSLDDPATLPWQRVINAGGGISSRGDTTRAERQRAMLREEGVDFPENKWSCDLDTYEWNPTETFWSRDWEAEEEEG
jgi:methylated-DNA-protein-cysteine methyltransferase-like protein